MEIQNSWKRTAAILEKDKIGDSAVDIKRSIWHILSSSLSSSTSSFCWSSTVKTMIALAMFVGRDLLVSTILYVLEESLVVVPRNLRFRKYTNFPRVCGGSSDVIECHH